ncbi:hypothetical protein MLOOGBEN_18450 [Bacillus sp. EB106-08-02-XG196]|uniref:hypothetical protein n=1 Tax=Bacillus sp. EB106-08-02-XG196 TaxID=2737049 RepID=UPI0015C4D48B|nr:hypothetical protein [Bacillus sp. EB106-08-02-XG196]NWQ42686.1 hypothetical protein [Bacillus sp. EB106-08-02-XG196]
MFKKLRITLGIAVLLLAGFGLLTKNFVAQPFMMLGLSAFILVGGLDELKNGKKRRGYISIFLSVFVLAILVQSFTS